MASHKDGQLYGVARPKKDPKSSISSSSSLSFASNLSSLLSKPATTTTASAGPARHRPSKARKDDIFVSHHRSAKKRSAADISTDASPKDATAQVHQRDIGGVDAVTLHRSKRKMEEKARLYAAMKRGDYVPPSGRQRGAGGLGEEQGALVDFDRKWAERHDAHGGRSSADETSSDDGSASEGEMVEYTDEFGRARQGRRRSVERRQRQARAAAAATAELDESSARPAVPEAGLIHGDSIQSAAFDPDAAMAERMAAVAARRDRSMTPPDETHYDATKEVRSKGVGFYAFSGDKEAREKEMEALSKEREETEKRAQEREDRRAKREAELKSRRQVLEERRGKLEADRWLKGLEVEIGVGAAGDPGRGADASADNIESTHDIEHGDSATDYSEILRPY